MHSHVKKRRLAALEKRVSAPSADSSPVNKRSGNGNSRGPEKLKIDKNSSSHGPSNIRPQGPARRVSGKYAAAQTPVPTSSVISYLASASGAADQTQDLPMYQTLASDAIAPPFAKLLEQSSPGSGEYMDYTTNFIERLLSTSDRGLNPRDVIKGKVQDQMIVLDNPTSQMPQHGRQRKNSQAEAMAKRFLSQAKCRRQRNLVLDARTVRYTDFTALNRQWEDYMKGLLMNARSEEAAVGAADLHGAILTVISDAKHRRVGISGIVIREGENTFHVVTEDDRLLVLKKADAIFFLILPGNRRAELYGSRLRRPSAIGAAS